MPHFRDIYTKLKRAILRSTEPKVVFVEQNENFGQEFIPFGFKSKERECVKDVLGPSVLRS